ncbi:MAG TPA: DNA polymerase IV, partial [Polyangiaceae bacterium]|nr:DNA polymerase IV [Polyangiaceae bacterium]
RKPDGLVIVPADGVAAFLAPLPVERMWGVGPKTAPRLRALGFETIGDLARGRTAELERILGTWGTHIANLARGEDPRDVDPQGVARSVGAEETYDEDLVGFDAVAATLLAHASRVARRLVRSGMSARVVVVKVKYSDFSLRSRRTTLPEPVRDTDAIHRAAVELLRAVPLGARKVRLTGISVAGLVDGPPPRTLLPDAQADKRQKLEALSVSIVERFGDESALTRAALLGKGSR